MRAGICRRANPRHFAARIGATMTANNLSLLTTTEAAAFRIVAKTQSATAAARELYVSVTTIWRYIKKLESEIGAPLFYRPG